MGLFRSLPHTLPPAVFCALLLILPGQLGAQAQASTGVIRGIVTDSAGRPLENAHVSVRHLATNAERTLTTNARGVFVAPLLRVGVYNLTVRALGFQQRQRDSVDVRLGETFEANFALAPQAVQLEELTAQAPQ